MENKLKYPRTKHFYWSEGVNNDDKILHDLSNFIGKEIVILEKRDGENSTLMTDCCYARSLDSNNHPSRNWLKGLWGSMKHNIPENRWICGENLYAKHSLGYDDLDTYFEVFNIWNENNVCLSYDDTLVWCELLGLKHVPILYRGIFDVDMLKKFNIDTNKMEGYVVRLSESFEYKDFGISVGKFVRAGHVQTDEHWTTQKIEPNKLK